MHLGNVNVLNHALAVGSGRFQCKSEPHVRHNSSGHRGCVINRLWFFFHVRSAYPGRSCCPPAACIPRYSDSDSHWARSHTHDRNCGSQTNSSRSLRGGKQRGHEQQRGQQPNVWVAFMFPLSLSKSFTCFALSQIWTSFVNESYCNKLIYKYNEMIISNCISPHGFGTARIHTVDRWAVRQWCYRWLTGALHLLVHATSMQTLSCNWLAEKLLLAFCPRISNHNWRAGSLANFLMLWWTVQWNVFWNIWGEKISRLSLCILDKQRRLSKVFRRNTSYQMFQFP